MRVEPKCVTELSKGLRKRWVGTVHFDVSMRYGELQFVLCVSCLLVFFCYLVVRLGLFQVSCRVDWYFMRNRK